MNTGRRGIYIWLVMLGVAVGLIVLAGAIGSTALSAELALGIVVVYLGMVFAALAGNRMRALQNALPPLVLNAKTTPAARRAVQRARSRSSYASDFLLTDVGLIVNERRRDGQWNRHLAQIVSLDDDAVQPFLSVYSPAESSDRLALINFEIYDQTGRLQFSRQMEQYMRDGVNSIICDRQLPLEQVNEMSVRSGVWDLRISIDGMLAAMHSFNVTPSTEDRRRQFSTDGEAASDRLIAPEDDSPLSLEDLLREQRGRSDNSRN
jgi:hypothetical protein